MAQQGAKVVLRLRSMKIKRGLLDRAGPALFSSISLRPRDQRTRINYVWKGSQHRGTIRNRPMDFIERWFHLLADNGSGTTEAMYVMTLAGSILVLLGHLQLAAVAKRWVGHFPTRGDAMRGARI
jgi:hypothetical protein